MLQESSYINFFNQRMYVLLFFHWSRVTVELAIPCEKPGPRVFKGFTVGLHPRSWELVRKEQAQVSDSSFLSHWTKTLKWIWFWNLQIYNGMTQFGFDKPRREFR